MCITIIVLTDCLTGSAVEADGTDVDPDCSREADPACGRDCRIVDPDCGRDVDPACVRDSTT